MAPDVVVCRGRTHYPHWEWPPGNGPEGFIDRRLAFPMYAFGAFPRPAQGVAEPETASGEGPHQSD